MSHVSNMKNPVQYSSIIIYLLETYLESLTNVRANIIKLQSIKNVIQKVSHIKLKFIKKLFNNYFNYDELPKRYI